MRTLPSRGASLAELAAVLAILGLVFTLSIPALPEILSEEALATAAREVSGILTAARARAVFQGAEVGVKWTANSGDLVLSVYQDGNGDGVTTADIRKGVDKLVAGPYWLGSRYAGVTFSFVPGHGRPRSLGRSHREPRGPDPVRALGHLLVLARRPCVPRDRVPLEQEASAGRRPGDAREREDPDLDLAREKAEVDRPVVRSAGEGRLGRGEPLRRPEVEPEAVWTACTGRGRRRRPAAAPTGRGRPARARRNPAGSGRRSPRVAA